MCPSLVEIHSANSKITHRRKERKKEEKINHSGKI